MWIPLKIICFFSLKKFIFFLFFAVGEDNEESLAKNNHCDRDISLAVRSHILGDRKSERMAPKEQREAKESKMYLSVQTIKQEKDYHVYKFRRHRLVLAIQQQKRDLWMPAKSILEKLRTMFYNKNSIFLYAFQGWPRLQR